MNDILAPIYLNFLIIEFNLSIRDYEKDFKSLENNLKFEDLAIVDLKDRIRLVLYILLFNG